MLDGDLVLDGTPAGDGMLDLDGEIHIGMVVDFGVLHIITMDMVRLEEIESHTIEVLEIEDLEMLMQGITEAEVPTIVDLETITIIDQEVARTIIAVATIIEEESPLTIIEEQEPQHILEQLDHQIMARTRDQDQTMLIEAALDHTEEVPEVQVQGVILDLEVAAAEVLDLTEAADLVEVADLDLAVAVEEEEVVAEEVKIHF